MKEHHLCNNKNKHSSSSSNKGKGVCRYKGKGREVEGIKMHHCNNNKNINRRIIRGTRKDEQNITDKGKNKITYEYSNNEQYYIHKICKRLRNMESYSVSGGTRLNNTNISKQKNGEKELTKNWYILEPSSTKSNMDSYVNGNTMHNNKNKEEDQTKKSTDWMAIYSNNSHQTFEEDT